MACTATAPYSPWGEGLMCPCSLQLTANTLPEPLVQARQALPGTILLHFRSAAQARNKVVSTRTHPSPPPGHPPVMPRAIAVAVLAASVSWGEARPSGCSTMQVCALCAATMSRCLGKEGLPKRVWISSWVLRRRLATSCTSSTGHDGCNSQRQVSSL